MTKPVYYIPSASEPWVVQFPCFDKPDSQFDYYGGTFNLPPDHEFIGRVNQFAEENFTPAQRKHLKFSLGYRLKEIDGEQKAVVVAKSKHKQPVFDAKGDKIDAPSAYGGTTCRPKLSIDIRRAKDPGVVIRFNGVQIVKLVERNGGFEDVSGQHEGAFVGSSGSPVSKPQVTSSEPEMDDEIPF